MAVRWIERHDTPTLPGTEAPSGYLDRLAADGVLDEIDRLYDSAERGEHMCMDPMTAADLIAEARRRDADAG